MTARWRELHAVATVTTGDADDGSAGHGIRPGRPGSTVGRDGGRGRAHRSGPRGGAVRRPRRGRPRGAARPRDADEPAEPPDPAEAAVDGTRAALAAVLAAATPTARAALAVEHWWDESPALVAATAHTDVATVRADLSELRRQLAAAHAASLGRDEAELGWALSAATTDTLEHAADAAPVSDPIALVEDARTQGHPTAPHPHRWPRGGARPGGGRGDRAGLAGPGPHHDARPRTRLAAVERRRAAGHHAGRSSTTPPCGPSSRGSRGSTRRPASSTRDRSATPSRWS